QVADIDPIQTQQRPLHGETLRRRSCSRHESFLETAPAQPFIGSLAPIVEVTGDDHRIIRWQSVEQTTQQTQLFAPVAFPQAKMYADGMQVRLAGHVENGVQETPFLGTADRHIQILVVQYRKL